MSENLKPQADTDDSEKCHSDRLDRAEKKSYTQHKKKAKTGSSLAYRRRSDLGPERRHTGRQTILKFCAWFLLPFIIVAATKCWKIISYNLGESRIRQAPIYHIVDLPGKGKGVIAVRDIRQGELLIREKPLFLLPSTAQGDPSVLINQTLAALSDAERASFFSLSFMPDTLKGYDAISLATLQTNAISAAGGIGIFPETARLNHGCSAAFNAVYSWRDREHVLVVHALKGIRRGEEILTTYTDTKRPRDQRRAFLDSHYHFHCSCSVCALPDALSFESDIRLVKMSTLYESLASWVDGAIDGAEASEKAIKIWRLGEQEGYWSERGRLAADVVHVAAAHSDAEGVISWGKLALEWFTYELGPDNDLTSSMRNLIAEPRSHAAWASRPQQRTHHLKL